MKMYIKSTTTVEGQVLDFECFLIIFINVLTRGVSESECREL